MELADAISINKADGENKQAAMNAKAEYNRFLHFLQPITEGWETKAFTVSAITGEGVSNIWRVIQKYKQVTSRNGCFGKRRKEQMIDWVHSMIEDQLKARFYGNPSMKKTLLKWKDYFLTAMLPPHSQSNNYSKFMMKMDRVRKVFH